MKISDYQSDRFGFRNDDALWNKPQIDAVLIGDSYAHGACVGQADTIAGQIQARGVDSVLNLATGGNGPIHYAALAKTFLPVIKPKYALFFFFANDNKDETQSIYRDLFFGDAAPAYFQPLEGRGRPTGVSDTLLRLYNDARTRMHVPGDDAALTPAPIKNTRPPPGIPFFEKVKGALSLRDLRSLLTSVVVQWRAAAVPPWSTRLAIDTALSICREVGCRPIFFYLPNSDFWSPDFRANAYRRSIKAYVEDHAPPGAFVDLTPTIAALGLKGFSPKGKHYSSAGYGRAVGRWRMCNGTDNI